MYQFSNHITKNCSKFLTGIKILILQEKLQHHRKIVRQLQSNLEPEPILSYGMWTFDTITSQREGLTCACIRISLTWKKYMLSETSCPLKVIVIRQFRWQTVLCTTKWSLTNPFKWIGGRIFKLQVMIWMWTKLAAQFGTNWLGLCIKIQSTFAKHPIMPIGPCFKVLNICIDRP